MATNRIRERKLDWQLMALRLVLAHRWSPPRGRYVVLIPASFPSTARVCSPLFSSALRSTLMSVLPVQGLMPYRWSSQETRSIFILFRMTCPQSKKSRLRRHSPYGRVRPQENNGDSFCTRPYTSGTSFRDPCSARIRSEPLVIRFTMFPSNLM